MNNDEVKNETTEPVLKHRLSHNPDEIQDEDYVVLNDQEYPNIEVNNWDSDGKGSLIEITGDISKEALNVIINEILNRLWIITLTYGSDDSPTKTYYAMLKPMIGPRDFMSKPDAATFLQMHSLKPYDKTTNNKKALIFDWTRRHNWEVLDVEFIKRVIDEMGSDRGFYMNLYYNFIKSAEYKKNNLTGDPAIDSTTRVNYVNALVNKFFNKKVIIPSNSDNSPDPVNDLLSFNELGSDERELLKSIFYLIKIIPNLSHYTFSNANLSAILDRVKNQQGQDTLLNFNDYKHNYAQYLIKTYDHEKILNRLHQDYLDAQFIRTLDLKKSNKIIWTEEPNDILTNFQIFFKNDVLHHDEVAMKCFWRIHFMLNENDEDIEYSKFKKELLDFKLIGKDETHTTTLRQEFYHTFIAPIDRSYWSALNTQIFDEYKSQALIKDTGYNAMEVKNMELQYRKNWNKILSAKFKDDLEIAQKQFAFDHSKEGEDTVTKKWNEHMKELLALENDRRNKWDGLSHTTSSVFKDIAWIIEQIKPLKYYLNFNQSRGIWYATYEDLSNDSNILTAKDTEILKLNFHPSYSDKNLAPITFFDPTIKLEELSQRKGLVKNAMTIKKLYERCFKVLTGWVGWKVNENGEHVAKIDPSLQYTITSTNNRIVNWKPWDLCIADLLKFYFSALTLTNTKIAPILDDTFETSTLNWFMRWNANVSFSEKLDTSFLVIYGKGGDGKSAWRMELQQALGKDNTYESSSAMTNNANQFSDQFKKGRFLLIYDDNSKEAVDNLVDILKSISNKNGNITYEVKGENRVDTYPARFSVLINTNFLPYRFTTDSALERRLRLLVTMNRTESALNGVYQPDLFKQDMSFSRWIVPIALNTYISDLYDERGVLRSAVKLDECTKAMLENRDNINSDNVLTFILTWLITVFNKTPTPSSMLVFKGWSIKNPTVEQTKNRVQLLNDTWMHVNKAEYDQVDSDAYFAFSINYINLYKAYLSWNDGDAKTRSLYNRDNFIGHLKDIISNQRPFRGIWDALLMEKDFYTTANYAAKDPDRVATNTILFPVRMWFNLDSYLKKRNRSINDSLVESYDLSSFDADRLNPEYVRINKFEVVNEDNSLNNQNVINLAGIDEAVKSAKPNTVVLNDDEALVSPWLVGLNMLVKPENKEKTKKEIIKTKPKDEEVKESVQQTSVKQADVVNSLNEIIKDNNEKR